MERYKYKVEDVVGDLNSSPIPTILSRTYIEQSEIRNIIGNLFISGFVACDFGAGFGRLTPVLTEFSKHVFAFEREEEFREIIKTLNPEINVGSLEAANDFSNYFDVILCWTVLQHMHQDELVSAISKIKNMSRQGSYLILCEEILESDIEWNPEISKEKHICIARTFEVYANLLGPDFSLVEMRDRPKEKTNNRDVGKIMIFQKKE